jgi:hypothetical protein
VNLLKLDLVDDVCGNMRPLSGLNYNSILVHCYWMFRKIEEKLKARYNQTWAQAYVGQCALTQREVLTVAALGGRDPECLEVIAGVFEEQSPGFMDHIYWDTLSDISGQREIAASGDDKTRSSPDSCTIM